MPYSTPATALVLASNVPVSVDVSTNSGPEFTTYFSYTAEGGDFEVSVQSHAPVASNYDPWFVVYVGVGLGPFPTGNDSSDANKGKLIPVVPGTTYIFEVKQNNVGVTPNANLSFGVYRSAGETAPVGSIAIPADGAGTGLGMILIDPATGHIYGVVPAPPGEGGTQLPTGEIALTNKDTSQINFFTSNMTLVNTASISGFSNTTTIQSNHVDKFYVSKTGSGGANGAVYIFSKTGTLLSTINFPSNTVALPVPSLDDSIIYMSTSGAGTHDAIRRWSVAGATFLSDLFTQPTTDHHVKGDILVLNNGNIVFAYRQFVSPYAETIYIVDPSGTVLHTISLPGGTFPTLGLDHMALGADGDSFFVWLQNGHFARFIRYSSTGAVISTTPDMMMYDTDGDALGDNSGAAYDGMPVWGPHTSCPILSMTQALAATGTPAAPPNAAPNPCDCGPTTTPPSPPVIPQNPPVIEPEIGEQLVCVGGGVVPIQPDLAFAEQWWGY